jgi:uncharacterized protein
MLILKHHLTDIISRGKISLLILGSGARIRMINDLQNRTTSVDMMKKKMMLKFMQTLPA